MILQSIREFSVGAPIQTPKEYMGILTLNYPVKFVSAGMTRLKISYCLEIETLNLPYLSFAYLLACFPDCGSRPL
jgi:hypothetical protein